MIAVKLFKYCIDVCNVNDPDIHLDASTEKVPYTPFITYFTNTLLQLANVHATYRVMIYEEDSFSNVLQQKEESNHNESSGCSGSDEDIIEEMETSDPDRHRLRLLVWLMNPSVYVFSNAFRALKVEEEEEEKKKTATTSTINTPFYSDLKRVFGGVSCDSLTQCKKPYICFKKINSYINLSLILYTSHQGSLLNPFIYSPHYYITHRMDTRQERRGTYISCL